MRQMTTAAQQRTSIRTQGFRFRISGLASTLNMTSNHTARTADVIQSMRRMPTAAQQVSRGYLSMSLSYEYLNSD